jgi:hypothetical protein
VRAAKGAGVGAIHDTGVVNAVIACLEHQSPFCVAAAAEALRLVGDTWDGQAFFAGNGAVSALVSVMKRQALPADIEKETGTFSRCAHADERFYVSLM